METQALPTRVSDRFFRAFCPDPTVIYDLEKLYNEYNTKFFNGDLPELVRVIKKVKGGEITSYSRLKWDGRLRSRTYGTYSSGSRSGFGVIRLSRSIAKDPVLTKSTLLHEMLHQWLDLKGLDDGIRGHGEQFIRFAKQINLVCLTEGNQIRIWFYDRAITQDTPEFHCELIGETIYSVKDLDITRSLDRVLNSAFDGKHQTTY
jgi:hypothetical protein